MAAALEEFLARLPAEVRERLDGSPDSLGTLEASLLEGYPTMLAIVEDEEHSYLGDAARYVGEVFRTALGGHWRLRLMIPSTPSMAFPSYGFSRTRTHLMLHIRW